MIFGHRTLKTLLRNINRTGNQYFIYLLSEDAKNMHHIIIAKRLEAVIFQTTEAKVCKCFLD